MQTMGKFNSADGVNFNRTIKDIVNDYARFLLDNKIIDDEEFFKYVKKGNNELLDILFEKLYETQEHNGQQIFTMDAFFHYCKFVIKQYGGIPIWNEFIRDFSKDVESNKDTCTMASRGLGKSFFSYVLYPSFKMFLYPGTKFCNLSETPKQCVENLRILKNIIDGNEMLYQKKEVWKGKDLKWTERQIEYNGGMIITVTVGTSPKGLHVHYAMADDIYTEASVMTDEEIENYVFGQVYPIVQRLRGRLVVSGTPVHSKDIYHLLMNDKPECQGDLITDGRVSAKGFYSRTFPALDEKGEPTLPSVYTKRDLEKIRQIQGDIKFQREYLLRCYDKNATIFAMSLIKHCTDAHFQYVSAPENKTQEYIIGVDVATSGAASADASAFIVLELVPNDKGYKKIIRHVIHVKGMEVPEQIDTIERLSKLFNYAMVIVEKNNVGVSLIQDLARRNVHIKEFITTKNSKIDAIRYLLNEMEYQNLWFPEETPVIKALKQELINFGVKTTRSGHERMEALAGKDDLVMALAIANFGVREFGRTTSIICQD